MRAGAESPLQARAYRAEWCVRARSTLQVAKGRPVAHAYLAPLQHAILDIMLANAEEGCLSALLARMAAAFMSTLSIAGADHQAFVLNAAPSVCQANMLLDAQTHLLVRAHLA